MDSVPLPPELAEMSRAVHAIENDATTDLATLRNEMADRLPELAEQGATVRAMLDRVLRDKLEEPPDDDETNRLVAPCPELVDDEDFSTKSINDW